MTRKKTWRSGGLLLVAMMLAVAASISLTPAATAQGLIESEIVYVVDVETQSVEVTETFDAGSRTDTFETLIPTNATNLRTSVGVTRTETGELLDTLILTPRGVQSFTLTYTLPSAAERSAFGGARVNDSYVGFSVWPVYANELRVELAAGFRSRGNLGLFEENEVGKETYEYVAEVNSSDDLWGYRFVALQDSALSTRVVDTGFDQIEVTAWEGDAVWLDFTSSYVAEGVPVLQELIGQPWPEENLRIFESAAPGREGYAGWYSRTESEIEVSDSLDAATLLHELSHAWFNDRFYEDRWMIEGFAEEISSEALAQIDGDRAEPLEPGEIPDQFDGLARWRSRFFFEDTWELERFGYRTSWYVMDALSDEIGQDGMARTIGAMQSGRGVHSLEGEPVLHPANNWRRFLDMLELHGGSTQAEELFRTWVVPEEDLPLLDQRRNALDALDTFAHRDMASVPFGVRDAVSRWHFDVAASRLAEAKTIRAELDQLAIDAAANGLSLPPVIEELYVDSDKHFTVVSGLIDRAAQTLAVFESDPGQLTDPNRKNFEAGRFELIDIDVSAMAGDGLNQGATEDNSGTLYLIALGGLAVVMLGSWGLLSRLRNGVPPESEPIVSEAPAPPRERVPYP